MGPKVKLMYTFLDFQAQICAAHYIHSDGSMYRWPKQTNKKRWDQDLMDTWMDIKS